MDSQHAGTGYLALRRAPAGRGSVAATAVYYGGQEIDIADARSAFLGHFAEEDPYVDEDGLVLLESELHLVGREVAFHRYPATRHWFAEEGSARARPRRHRPRVTAHPGLPPLGPR